MLNSGDIFEYKSKKFVIEYEQDDSGDAPWEVSDMHGPVSDWTTRSKSPGEWVLSKDRGSYRYYDAQEAMKIAKKDGWDAAPYNEGETKGQRAAKAVKSDFEYLRSWCNDEWTYLVVIVYATDDEGEKDPARRSVLGGVESSSNDYILEVAQELADELL